MSDEACTTLLIQMRDPADPPAFRAHESNGQEMMLRGVDLTCATRHAWEQSQAPDGMVVEGNGSGRPIGLPMGGVMAGAMGGKM